MKALASNLIDENQIDDMLRRIFLTRMRLGEFDLFENNPYNNIPSSVLDSPQHRELARESTSSSTVLLKNSGVLPLQLSQIKKLAVIGPNAHPSDPSVYLHSYNGQSSHVVDILEGVTNAVYSNGITVLYAQGCDIQSNSTSGFNEAIAAAREADVSIVVLGTTSDIEREGKDRSSLELPGVQSQLLSAIHQVAKETVLVLVNGASLIIDETLASAILETWYGGEEAGNGLADIIFGKVNPSARLPLTFYSSNTQLRPIEDYNMDKTPGRTYRYFAGQPLYYFGFGLSYTQFRYENITVIPENAKPTDVVSVSGYVSNIGQLDGHEIVQLYVSVPTHNDLAVPRWSLQGFKKVFLRKGEKIAVSFSLAPYQYSTVKLDGERVIYPGTYTVTFGGSQLDDSKATNNVLKGSFTI
eukprot:TRINITY_DN1193_c0_g1_i1.p1 TRINITY_DN1193_c0_g1~~TRINITY_DN1193_c0_g1_i1.p1  ORF type:complete len:413 (-),score=89.96 TRINITY_DN1193_c0_g1_i1:12-1250(-)